MGSLQQTFMQLILYLKNNNLKQARQERLKWCVLPKMAISSAQFTITCRVAQLLHVTHLSNEMSKMDTGIYITIYYLTDDIIAPKRGLLMIWDMDGISLTNSFPSHSVHLSGNLDTGHNSCLSFHDRQLVDLVLVLGWLRSTYPSLKPGQETTNFLKRHLHFIRTAYHSSNVPLFKYHS